MLLSVVCLKFGKHACHRLCIVAAPAIQAILDDIIVDDSVPSV